MKKIEYLKKRYLLASPTILSSITLNHSFGFAHVCKIVCKTNFVFNFGSFLLSFIFVSWEKISCLKLGARFILILISTNTTFARKMLFLIGKVSQKGCFQNAASLPCQCKKTKNGIINWRLFSKHRKMP